MKNLQNDLGLLFLRIGIGGIMLFQGVSKMANGIEALFPLFEQMGIPGWIAYAVYLGEVTAPVMLLIGFRCRLAALAIVITMLVAIYLGHPQEIFKLGKYGEWALEVQGLYLTGSLAIFFLGGGKLALSRSKKWD